MNRNNKDGHSDYCKSCVKIANANRHIVHPYTILKQDILNKTNGKCYLCGSNNDVDVHHILPRTMGGKDYKDNLVPLCKNCHLKAHNGSFGYGGINGDLSIKFKEFASEISTEA